MRNCPICRGPGKKILDKEFNVSCGDYFEGYRLYKDNIGSFCLHACGLCEFAWYPEFEAWNESDFLARIYNGDYRLCDPPFEYERPASLANWLNSFLGIRTLLDFGGGEGTLARMLRSSGKLASVYDPYYGNTTLPHGTYDIVTAFEVIEHVPDQDWLIRSLLASRSDTGVLIFSTLLRAESDNQDWWYASPRNGHCCFHSAKSLKILMDRHHLYAHSLSDELHVAARDIRSLDHYKGLEVPRISGEPKFKFVQPWSAMEPI